MANKGRIKNTFSETDLNRMKREIKNFNARRAYQIKMHPETAEYQPEKLTLKKALKTISGKKDLKALENSLKRYTAESAQIKTNKYGVKSSKYVIDETRRNIAKENKRRANNQDKDVFVNGRKIETAAKTASKFDKKPIKRGFTEAKTSKEWKEFTKAFKFIGAKKQEEKEKSAYFHHLKQAFEKMGCNDEYWVFFETLGYNTIWSLYKNGFDSVDMEFIYDVAIDSDEKDNKIFDELTAQILNRNLYGKALEKLKEYYGIKDNDETGKLWRKIPPVELWAFYMEGGQINNPEELLYLIDRISEDLE